MTHPLLIASQRLHDAFIGCLANARLMSFATMLLMLIQRSPLTKWLLDGRLGVSAPRLAHVFKSGGATASIGLATTHAVTGATDPSVTPAEGSNNPAEAAVGEEFAWGFLASLPGKKARSYLVEGLPPGIIYDSDTFPLSSSLAVLQGTPTTPGTFDVEITAFHFPNLQGAASPVYELTITVTGGAVEPPPVVTKALLDRVAAPGDRIELSVEVQGEALAFQWEKDDVAIPDSDSPTLSLENVSAADSGRYTVKISNPGGEVSSTADVQVATQALPLPSDQTLYSISPREPILRVINADGSAGPSVAITMEEHEVTGGTGLARDPISGILYAMLKVQEPPAGTVGDRVLATLDPTTGEARFVGAPAQDTLIKFSGLFFDANGQLFGLTGEDKGGQSPETLFTLDKTTAAPTEFLALGNGDEGETIAFDFERNLAIHASGNSIPGQTQVLETVDLANQTITPIQVGGDWNEGKALASLGAGRYLLADDEAIYLVTAEGDVMLLSLIDHATKGFALIPNTPTDADFAITHVERTDEGLLLRWPAEANATYVVATSSDLITWADTGEVTVPEGANEASYTDNKLPEDTESFFYRVRRAP